MRPRITAERNVVFKRERIGNSHARERQAFLVLEIGNLLGQSQMTRMFATLKKAGVEETGHVARARPGP